MTPALPYLALGFGLLCAAGGGEFFVRGTVGIARAARVSPAIAAATVAAFATSSPELTVAISSALAGEPEISLGDALGSNVVNLALILATALALAPLAVDRATVLRDYATAAASTIALTVVLIDGVITRMDAMILLAGFILWIVAVVREARRQRSVPPTSDNEKRTLRAAIETSIGLALLIVAGKLIVYGADDIARRYGLGEFLIGATLVAIGTSVPELATAVIARLRGHDEVGLGALLGSNIFNGLFIVGVAGAITPIHAPIRETAPALIAGAIALLIVLPPRGGVYWRWRGVALLATYTAYLAATIAT